MSDGPRRTWAPFVGAALAALTAGSLVVFALVAQRTSLDGFPELRIATPADDGGERPASITVAPVDGGADASREVASSDEPGSTEPAELTATSPLALIPLQPRTTPSTPLDVASLHTPAAPSPNASGDRRRQGQEKIEFDGRFRADGVLLAARSDGGSDSVGPRTRAAGSDARHHGKHAHKSREAKSTKHKSKKGKKQKRSNHGNTHRHSQGRAHGHGSQGSSHAAPPSASRPSNSQSKSHRSAAPRPKSSPSSSSKQGPPAHSNAGGNGKSNGKGHKKH